MRDSLEDFNAKFASILDRNPSPLRLQRDPLCPELKPATTFYDKHLDERLSLKTVTVLPSFISHLSKFVDEALKRVLKDDVDIPSVNDSFPNHRYLSSTILKGPATDAKSLGQVYQITTSATAITLASMLSLHPTASEWSSVLLLNRQADKRNLYPYALHEGYAPELLIPGDDLVPLPENSMLRAAWGSIEDSKRKELEETRHRFPMLAVWQMLFACGEAEAALKHFDDVASRGSYSHVTFHTVAPGIQPANTDLPFSPDAKDTAWVSPISSIVDSPAPLKDTTSATEQRDTRRRSQRKPFAVSIKGRGSVKHKGKMKPLAPHTAKDLGRSWPNITLPIETATNVAVEELEKSLLQHAWGRTAERDSSFLVFHCGIYERIAFRHRTSQTLYISEAIDVANCANPAYGKIHVGLYMAILEDVLDRTRQLMQHETGIRRSKRKHDSLQSRGDYKRPKTRRFIALKTARQLEALEAFQTVCDELPDRSLVLLRIQHGPFNSPIPASFLRIVDTGPLLKTTYGPQEYFTITITSEIGHGATGDTHTATIELLTSEGRTVSFSDIVVKLALEGEQQARLRHEFSVYQHLKAFDVKGIPHIFGLFKEVEGGTLVLIMNNVSTPLRKRMTNTGFTISDGERESFATIMRDIHEAGVRHRDIRPDNLVISDDGISSIIDFDIARISVSESSRKREYDYLVDLLNGEALPLNVSPGTPKIQDEDFFGLSYHSELKLGYPREEVSNPDDPFGLGIYEYFERHPEIEPEPEPEPEAEMESSVRGS
ncbi:hypothetical protein H0H87_005259 [Tephrocybe sp. NHM501043]|nr:hypothetical protein H0H87_005259 [Tephrocybe sp. NHM501043]